MVRGSDGTEAMLTSPLPYNQDTHDFVMPYDWSPDGQAVLASFDHPNQHFSLGLFPLAAAPHAEKAVKIVASDVRYNFWQGNYSPDGRWIAFVVERRSEPGLQEVAVMPSSGADASAWFTVTDYGRLADKPRWSPDGRLLYFFLADGAFYDVWAVRFDPIYGKTNGRPFQVTQFHSPARQIVPDLGINEPSVSATRLILPMLEKSGSIWMLDNVDK